jgi:hypothetical protein
MQRANLQYWKKYHGRLSLFLYLMIGCLSYAVRAVGWAAIFLLKKSSRSRANLEVKQYLKCIRWVFESRTLNELVKQ